MRVTMIQWHRTVHVDFFHSSLSSLFPWTMVYSYFSKRLVHDVRIDRKIEWYKFFFLHICGPWRSFRCNMHECMYLLRVHCAPAKVLRHGIYIWQAVLCRLQTAQCTVHSIRCCASRCHSRFTYLTLIQGYATTARAKKDWVYVIRSVS